MKRPPLIDWDNPPELDAPRRRWIRQLIADKIKLVRLQQLRAKGAKKHSTNRERSFADRTAAATTKRQIAERDAQFAAYKKAVHAYWAGETDQYPEHPAGSAT